MPDIDIDFYNRDLALEKIKHVTASIREDDTFKKHNTGVYCTSVPYDPVTGLSTIDYRQAEERGYFKIDFLNVSIYKDIKSEQELIDLLKIEPLWDLLEQKEFCDLIFHVNGYHELIASLKPRSIEEMAMFLALLRPGKKHLVPIVREKGFQEIKDAIWIKTEDSYSFKKSHAVAYAHAIAVQMNKICEAVSYGFS
jgi:DNA polymerase III alpha subunit